MSMPKNNPLCWDEVDYCWGELDFCWNKDWVFVVAGKTESNIPFTRELDEEETKFYVTLMVETVQGEDYEFKQTKEKKKIEVVSKKLNSKLEEKMNVSIKNVYIYKKDNN